MEDNRGDRLYGRTAEKIMYEGSIGGQQISHVLKAVLKKSRGDNIAAQCKCARDIEEPQYLLDGILFSKGR